MVGPTVSVVNEHTITCGTNHLPHCVQALFDAHALPVEAFSESIGLPSAPRLRFLVQSANEREIGTSDHRCAPLKFCHSSCVCMLESDGA
jgi:hypothetical protein